MCVTTTKFRTVNRRPTVAEETRFSYERPRSVNSFPGQYRRDYNSNTVVNSRRAEFVITKRAAAILVRVSFACDVFSACFFVLRA